MRKIALIALVLLMLAVMAASAAAQDGSGLSEEQRAQVRRAVRAASSMTDYADYVVHTHESSERTITIHSLGQTLTGHESVVRDAVTTYVSRNDGGQDIQALIEAEVESTEPSSLAPTAYTLSAEVRRVDGVLYVLASRETNVRTGLSIMPEGWIIVENVSEWPALQALDLGNYLDNSPQNSLLTDPDTLINHAANVTVTPTSSSEETSPDEITITLTGSGARAALQDTSTTAALYLAADDASRVTLRVTVSADDRLIAQRSEMTLAWTGLDLNKLDSEIPANAATANIVLETSSFLEITQSGTDLGSIAAP